MKNIFQILQEKEEQLRALQAQIEKLRAAAEIVAQEQGAPMAAPAAPAEPPRGAAVAASTTPRANVPADVPVAGHRPVWP